MDRVDPETLAQFSAKEVRALVRDLHGSRAGIELHQGLLHCLCQGIPMAPSFARLHTSTLVEVREPVMDPFAPMVPPRDAQVQHEDLYPLYEDLLRNAPPSWLTWPRSWPWPV